MAFDIRNLDLTNSGSKGVAVVPTFDALADNKAAVKGAGYFNAAADELSRAMAMFIRASDATILVKVSVSAGVVTIADMDPFA